MIDFSSVSQRTFFCRSVHGHYHNGLVTPVVLVLSAFVIFGRVFGDPAPPSEVRALGDIFAEGHIIDAALDVHHRALQLSPQERFEFLAHWVLPNDAHSSLRLDVGFSPTYPAPVENENPTPDGIRVPSGRDIGTQLISEMSNCLPVIHFHVRKSKRQSPALAKPGAHKSGFSSRALSVPPGAMTVEGKRPGKPFLPRSVVLGPVNSGLWTFSGEVRYERAGAGLA
ncbi:MAG: hypothetical protein WKF77_04755 [Planctomycetaceae bacterium]